MRQPSALGRVLVAVLVMIGLGFYPNLGTAEAYGLTPHNYIRNVRVRLSCHALVFSPKRLSEIAMNFGFADQSHFTNEFHRLMGETPGAYRQRFKPKGAVTTRRPKPRPRQT